MDTYSSSGEKLNIKTRKPYTITKQRERWTEEEHNSFLEALKLYGRAWQRIEEHIGTKTAVQIRSHAQKFFTKLEKEAVAKGVPTRQALDMEIPPPRPKRKPNYPYPRKTGSGTCPKTHHPNPNPKEEEDNATHHHQPTLVSSLPSGIDHPHLPEYHEQKQEEIANTSEQVDVDVDVDVEKEEPPCASLSSENDNSIIPRGVFRDFINLDETNESYITTIETRKYQKKSDQDGMHTSSLFDFPEGQNHDDNSITNTNGVHSYPRHVPVQVVDGNQGSIIGIPTGTEEMSTLEEKWEQVHNNPNPNPNNIASRCCSSYQTIPTFHPPVFTHPFSDNHNNNNEEERYRSFLHVSSTISSLIVSSLLQNPAAHAAASFAAKFWHPPGNTEASSGDDSETQTPSTPSMTSIAAATVAAATAWWAAHGLLPVCPPFYPTPTPTPTPFSFGAPPPPPPVTVEDGNQAREKAPPEKITGSSSSEEEEEEDSEGKLNTGSNPDDDNDTTKGTGTGTVVEETNVNVRKQVDRSSCGSNTTSSSEIETDALEKKNIKEQEETAAAASDVPDLDSISRASIIRGGRSTINPNESWKEVSEEGRLAFQALFSRQVLPQSFSDRHKNNINNNNNNNGGGGELDLNRMMLRGEKNMEEGLLTIGLGNVKLNVNNTHTHTGFKPYKRCSMEAKEKPGSSSNQNDDKAAKRMRFQAEGST